MSDQCASDHRLEGLASTTHAALCTGVAASTLNADCAFLGARHHRARSLVIKEEHWHRPGSGSAFAAVVRQIHAPPGAEALDCAWCGLCIGSHPHGLGTRKSWMRKYTWSGSRGFACASGIPVVETSSLPLRMRA